MEVQKRIKELEDENARLQKLLDVSNSRFRAAQDIMYNHNIELTEYTGKYSELNYCSLHGEMHSDGEIHEQDDEGYTSGSSTEDESKLHAGTCWSSKH